MKIIQNEIGISPKSRGFHLITDEIQAQLPELRELTTGIAHIFIMHTSASLTINENADPDVRYDMEDFFNHNVPDDLPFYRHTAEGKDDMTSHIKSSILGSSVSVPVLNGRFKMGTWQGIYLCEHRNHGGSRKITVTLFGE